MIRMADTYYEEDNLEKAYIFHSSQVTETENERIKFQYFKLNFFIKFEKFIKFLENIYIILNDSYIYL